MRVLLLLATTAERARSLGPRTSSGLPRPSWAKIADDNKQGHFKNMPYRIVQTPRYLVNQPRKQCSFLPFDYALIRPCCP